jgi:DNA-binding NtrC family response regulator
MYFALISAIMFATKTKKKILIVDEAGFSRICSAILEHEGYGTDTVSDVCRMDATVNYADVGLVITSYPYGAVLFDQLRKRKIPTIILSDQLNKDLITTLEDFGKSLSHCLIKPLDYTKFRTLVNQVMLGGGIITD